MELRKWIDYYRAIFVKHLGRLTEQFPDQRKFQELELLSRDLKSIPKVDFSTEFDHNVAQLSTDVRETLRALNKGWHLKDTPLHILASSFEHVFDRKVFAFILPTLDREHRERIIGMLNDTLRSDQRHSMQRGLIYEMLRVHMTNLEGLEKIVPYAASHTKDQPRKDRTDPDMAFLRREKKPHLYEFKYQSIFSSKAQCEGLFRQLNRYQAAVDRGDASGITIEIRGPVPKQLLKFLLDKARTSLRSVEFVMSIPIPTGPEYRFTIMEPIDKNVQGLKYMKESRFYQNLEKVERLELCMAHLSDNHPTWYEQLKAYKQRSRSKPNKPERIFNMVKGLDLVVRNAFERATEPGNMEEFLGSDIWQLREKGSDPGYGLQMMWLALVQRYYSNAEAVELLSLGI